MLILPFKLQSLISLFLSGHLQKQVTLNTFLDALMSDPPPQCLVWLPLMHRLANVENGEAHQILNILFWIFALSIKMFAWNHSVLGSAIYYLSTNVCWCYFVNIAV